MTNNKKQPAGVCTKCGYPTTNDSLVNGRCDLKFKNSKNGSVRCTGTIRGKNNIGDWKDCPVCCGNKEKCTTCHDTGYVLNK